MCGVRGIRDICKSLYGRHEISTESEFKQPFSSERAAKKAITKWRFRRTKPIMTVDDFNKYQNLLKKKLELAAQASEDDETQDIYSDDLTGVDQPLSMRKKFVHEHFQGAIW
ncbi:unnamed protein product [Didymodactylos carnosus]|uniref:Uncharacterized protein n=1 Tax=Didymodactylos carnosus TaxID=1234261 RepID=A0A813SPN1_9BILA|nr:unnamed protein product [Didymodactylos carnosus]CAF0803659.1 unnamed protein product [Didymodactylos carnosus]CAF3506244.1 unnamed protein product [Didymodactylos carnosus]CAF3588929.1 unnamed protein product [Didymodactylos carnosus]